MLLHKDELLQKQGNALLAAQNALADALKEQVALRARLEKIQDELRAAIDREAACRLREDRRRLLFWKRQSAPRKASSERRFFFFFELSSFFRFFFFFKVFFCVFFRCVFFFCAE